MIGAQIELERALTEISGIGGSTAEITAQLGILTSLQRAISTSDRAGLAVIRNEVLATAAGAQSLAENVRAAANGTAGRDSDDVRSAARATLANLQADLFARHTLDPYLQFASAEDERAYREREAKRLAEIERARASGTPDGDARAGQLLIEQIRDAGAHGADRSPDYQRMLRTAESSTAALQPASTTVPSRTDTGPAESEPPGDDLAAAMGALRDAGVIPAGVTESTPAHGIAAAKSVTQTRSV